MYFLGTAMEPASLRHDLCFLLIIDDPAISALIKPNDECNSVINCMSAKRLLDLNFRLNYTDNEKDLQLLNNTSAALWQLAKGAEVFQRIVIPEEARNAAADRKGL